MTYVWKKKSKGSAHIYTAEGIPHAVVDRRGLGLVFSITYRGRLFSRIDEAQRYAEETDGRRPS